MIDDILKEFKNKNQTFWWFFNFWTKTSLDHCVPLQTPAEIRDREILFPALGNTWSCLIFTLSAKKALSYLDFLRLVFNDGLVVPQVSLKLFVTLQKGLAQFSSQLEVCKKEKKNVNIYHIFFLKNVNF